MAAYRPLVAVLVPALLVAPLLAGCEAVNSASNTVDRAQLCTQAVSAAGFTPDVNNPSASVAEAQRRAGELRTLSEKTTDADLKRELQELADHFAALQANDVTPAEAASWGQRTLTQLDELRRTCGL